MSAVCDIEVSDSNSYIFSSVRQGDLVIRLSGTEAGLHAGYTVPESNALLSATKEIFRFGGNNSNVSISNNTLQASNINFIGALTQNGVPFVSGGGSVAGISNLSYETSNLMTFHVGSNTSNDGFRWLSGSGSNEVMSLTGDGKLFAGSILPSTTLTYDLGSSNNRWRDLYLSGNTINMGGVQLTADSNNNFMIMDSNNNLKTIMTGEVQIGQNTRIMSEHAGQIMFKSMGSNVMTMCNTMVSLNTNLQVAAPLNLQGLQINRRGGNALNVSLQPQFITNGSNIYINSGSNFGIGTTNPQYPLDVNGTIKCTSLVGSDGTAAFIDGVMRVRAATGRSLMVRPVTSGVSLESWDHWENGGTYQTMNMVASEYKLNVGGGVAKPALTITGDALGDWRSITLDGALTTASIAASNLTVTNTNDSYTSPVNTTVPNIVIQNPNNASSSAHAILTLRTGGTAGGSPFIAFDVANEYGYTMGMRNSDNTFRVTNGFGDLGSAGVFLSPAATSWSGTSDERLKDIIENIDDGLNKVCTLRSVIGKFKKDNDSVRRPFLIAQDVDTVLPEAVDKANPDEWGLRYTDIVPLLVSAIKDVNTKLTELAHAVEELRTQR